MGATVAFMALCSSVNAQQTTTFYPQGSDGVDAVSYERAKLQFIQDNPEYFIGNQSAVASRVATTTDYDARKEAAHAKSEQQTKARNTAMAEAGLLNVDRNQLNERERSKYDAKQAEIDANFPKD